MTDSEPAREVMLQILRTRLAFRQAVQRILKRHRVGMTFEMMQIMHRLWTCQGVSQQYLAEQTARDKACLTNLIGNLEKKNWVERREDPADRRNRLVYLTPEGEALGREVRPLLKSIYARAVEKIGGGELQACRKTLGRLNEVFDEI